jgi:ABC-type proline/glycine betaine transport system permease subunit
VAEEQLSQGQGQQATPAEGKLSKRAQEQAQVMALKPATSIWPIALALSLFIMLLGIMTYPIIIGIGAVMTIAAIIGWGVERR